MKYFGGKGRVARRTANVITELGKGRNIYIEPFVGGAYVLAQTASSFEHVVASDINPSLIAFWNAVVHKGWIPPSEVSREEWNRLRHSDEVSPTKAWAGCAASYCGRWFEGYAATSNGVYKHDYVKEAINSLNKKTEGLINHPNLEFHYCDYRDYTESITSDMVIYCDPPYQGVTGYPYGGEFNTVEFWNTMAQWSYRGALVFVHEFSAPIGWLSILELERVSTMSRTSSAIREPETLWTNGLESENE